MFKSLFPLLLAALLGIGAVGQAQQPQMPTLTFQNWKEQQILDAQNQVLRISARHSQIKRDKSESKDAKENAALPSNSKIRKSENESIATVEKELRRAQESLRGANESTLEEYVMVYLPTLKDSPEALQALAQKLSKEELAEIFKLLVSKDAPPDAKRSSPSLADGLSVSNRGLNP